MRYDVIALDAVAGEHRLQFEARDEAELRRVAAREGLAVVQLRACEDPSLRPTAGSAAQRRARTARFPLDLFCQELLAMVRSEIPVREALQTLARKDGPGGLIERLLVDVEEGLPLSQALAHHPAVFPPLLVESMRAAERTSDYVPALERFVHYRRLGQMLRGKLLAAALYPTLLLAVSLLVLLFLVVFVVPRFALVYEDMGDRLPLASRLLLDLGQTLSSHPGTIAAAVVMVLLLGRLAWQQGAGPWLGAALARAVPRAAALLRTAHLARLYRTLALLLNGGIAVADALELAGGVVPAAVGPRVAQARAHVREGRSFTDSLVGNGLATVVAERFFAVGEQTGRLAEMIDRAAEFHEEEVARAADWIARVVGPAMMLLMGVVIGTVVVLMYLPIFQISDALS